MAETKNIHGLTPMQEKFAQAKAGGMRSVDAFEAAGYGPTSNQTTKVTGAYHLSKKPAIQKRIEELQRQAEAGAILNVEQIQAELTNIGLDEKNSKNVRLKALDQLARTKGAYADNVNVNASGGLTIADKKEAFKELVGE